MNLKLVRGHIRSWQTDDAPALQRHADNRKLWVNLRDRFPHPYTITDAQKFIELVTCEKPETTFAISLDDEAIGCIGLQLGSDVHRKTAELGYWLAEPFWGKGIMTEAVREFTDDAFRSYDLVRIFAEPFASNAASIRVLEKNSFFCEGRLRAHVFKNGKLLDALVLARVSDVKT